VVWGITRRMDSSPLWSPSPERIRRANITGFREGVERRWSVRLADVGALYDFSIREREEFWCSVWDFCGIVAGTRGERVVEHPFAMPGARFFPDARLNFAANLLRRRDDHPAIVCWSETGERREMSFAALYHEVSRTVQAFRALGVAPGDRVAGYLPNFPETIVAAIAAAAIGAVWSSCSPDFGVDGVVDRFGQIAPKVLIAVDGYSYGGKRIDVLGRLGEVVARLPSIERLIVVPNGSPARDEGRVPGAAWWPDLLGVQPGGEIAFESLPFNHPLYILFSSGTTGVPKCIVHGAGGTLIQHLKEHRLHCDIRRGDRVFYFTTCGWMMWNWLVTALASEATLVLFDGSPFHPAPTVLFDLADAVGITLFGTSAKYIASIQKAGLSPATTHRLDALRTITSTGSPLAPESFDYVYAQVKRDVHLASISGGTDIVSCFVGGNPAGPVWRGEIQMRALGMAVEVFDEHGRTLRGEKGELVCTAPFPSMPVGFWNDPDDRKYHAAYFEKFPGVWCHGDWAAITPHDGVVIYGRSDATLNPGGVRIGTSEIYRVVERLDEVVESLAVAQDRDGDQRIVLFVRLRDGLTLDRALIDRIKQEIRTHASPRHVPARVVQVRDIPRTKSGKIVELAVREIVHGRPVKNVEALANPGALDEFRDRPELAD
jgi:acetoacetyl-CoA synthetase